jgi:putative endonuclease
MGRHNELGRLGEDKAAIYLEQKGFKILARNYRFGRAEVDIIAANSDLVLFVEVKTRSNYKFGFPEEAVSGKKQRLFGQAASEFMFQHKLSLDIRFDVITIVTSQNSPWTITHLEDAFFSIE